MTMATQIAGGVLSAYGQVQQGRAAYSSSMYQAGVAKQNSIIAKQNAEYAADSADRVMEKGLFTAEQNDIKTDFILGQQLTAQGGSGLDVNSASFRRTRTATAELGRMDTMSIRENANIDFFNEMIRSTNYENQSNMFQQESQFATQTAQNSLLAGYINAGSSLLSTASSVSKSFTTFGGM